MVHQYIGARYVPRFMGIFDPNQEYETLDVVDNGSGTSYISKIPTPAGTPLSDSTHWAIYGASSGAIINLQSQIDAINMELLKCSRVYGTVNDMIADSSIALDDVIGTQGYHAKGDGGQAVYVVTAAADPDKHTEALNNGLYAELIVTDWVNVKQCGAYGDGVHDDSAAFDEAISKYKNVISGEGCYLLASAVSISGSNKNIRLMGEYTYTGAGAAFDIKRFRYSDLFISHIVSDNDGLYIHSNGGNDWSQYDNITFQHIEALNYGINIKTTVDLNNGWVNEINFFGGKLAGKVVPGSPDPVGVAGVYCDYYDQNGGSGIRFYNIGLELMPIGYHFKNMVNVAMYECRHVEFDSNGSYIETVGPVNIHISDNGYLPFDYCNFSSDTSGYIESRITTSGISYLTRRAIIKNGGISGGEDYKGNLNAASGGILDTSIVYPRLKPGAFVSYSLTGALELKLDSSYMSVLGINEIYIQIYKSDLSAVNYFRVIDADGNVLLNLNKTGVVDGTYKLSRPNNSTSVLTELISGYYMITETLTSDIGSQNVDVYKSGNVVDLKLVLNNITCSAFDTLLTLPSEFRPVFAVNDDDISIASAGTVKVRTAKTNESIFRELTYLAR